MIITELYIKNFGKFSERHFYLRDGIQVIRGENEFGKSTLHSFMRAMLFGLERGRGRAAARDEFSRCEPWDNPGNYGGVMRFVCGERHFRLERSFSRLAKGASLVCEDDGEELSVEDGDLAMLMGGMSAELFDSTVSIGQLKAEPGQELFQALENYAANYFETGGGEYDLNAAFKTLKEKKKAALGALREEEAKAEAGREKIRQEWAYLERDMQRLRAEYEERKSEAEGLEAHGDKADSVTGKEAEKGDAGKRFRGLVSGGIAGLFAGALGVLWSRLLVHLTGSPSLTASAAPLEIVAWLIGGAGLMLLIAGIVLGRRRDTETERPEEPERKTGRERPEELERRLDWQMGRIRAEWKEKELRRDNLKEQYEESGLSDEAIRLRERVHALAMAEEALEKAARTAGGTMERTVGKRASEIFAEITEGRYLSLEMERMKGITVWDGVRRIPVRFLSRGTVEQIYFSIRMAAARMLSEEPMPVILDDVFAFYDDKRLESVLKWLSRQKNQVIIFTCHNREEEIVNAFSR